MDPLHPQQPSAKRAYLEWEPLQGCALSLALAQLAEQAQAPIIILTSDPAINQRLANEIAFFSQQHIPIYHFPDGETLPYDNFSPPQDVISQRLRTLSLLPSLSQGILLTTASTLLQRLAPREYIDAYAFHLTMGEKVSLDALKQRFVQAGYPLVSQVLGPGEFAVRGSLFDVYPMGSALPYRIDLYDNEIESIRTFDPENQRTISQVESISLLPAREFPFDKDAITLFRQQWRESFKESAPTECPIYELVSQGSSASGIEYYFPLFFSETATFFDYLPSNSVFVRVGELHAATEKYWLEIKERYEQLRHDRTRPLLTPARLFLTTTDIFTEMKRFARIDTQAAGWTLPDLSIDHKASPPLGKAKNYLSSQTDRLLLCTESPGRREALLALLHKDAIYPHPVNDWHSFLCSTAPLAITVAPFEQGMQLTSPAIQLIPETAFFGQLRLPQKRHKTKSAGIETLVKNLAELTIGAPVVHIDHGVGRYLGLQTLQIGDQLGEYLTLAYANNAKLYVPVAALQLISRYSGTDPDHTPLHKLGTDQWEKAKRKAAEKIRDTAAELLEVYAQRELREGFSYDLAEENYQQFASAFPFEETPDQVQAIEDVLSDMRAKRSMDRLICGDVGFGKTEVAMRAAFIAAQAGHQVAVLVPTTLLAQQHYENFCDRFADWPIRVGVLSRFRSAQEQQTLLRQLKEGQLDIVVGTHKLLQPTVIFKHLGLVIIDEEHRFGVQQKERLKKLRAEVDILTLTATPIPRTLNMAMSGIRDLSIISTPPARRLAIKTFVHPSETHLIREAILREIMRGGQVYYLFNNVEKILKETEFLQALVPEARIAIAHGQMRERELEQVMHAFYHQHSNVLVCTTIIETGIDIPSANTIIIQRADKFGLAQLHQLRGRVGRSHHQAYAYLLTPPKASLTADAEKRLEAIAGLEDLGAGFALATHDLEIRGSGEILGEAQSGSMQEIGFSLYMELLEKAVRTLQKGEKLDLLQKNADQIEIDLHFPTLIPEDYVPDVHIRLTLYKRLASTKEKSEIDELAVEFIDRFGLLPEATKNLFALTQLKLTAQTFGIQKIKGNAKQIHVEFCDKPMVDPLKIIHLLQKEPHKYKLHGNNKITIHNEEESVEHRITNLQTFFTKLL